MNILEHYLVKIISEERVKATGTEGAELIKVVAQWDCYGAVSEETDYYSPSEWKKIKEKGYYLG